MGSGRTLIAEATHAQHLNVIHDPLELTAYPRWSVSAWQNLGGRRKQEDRLAICPVLDDSSAFFGLWDGTVDDFVVDEVKRQVLPNILKSEHWETYQALREEGKGTATLDEQKTLQACLEDAVLATDKDVLSKCRAVQNHYSSCTGVMVLLTNNVLTVANLGDSRAALGVAEDGVLRAEPLTVDHKPDQPVERLRIEASGGAVQHVDSRDERLMRAFLCGGDYTERKARGENPKKLAYSRGFGGKDLKPYGLSSQPDVTQVVLDGRQKVLVMASDGLWDVCSEEKALFLAADAADRDMDPAQVLVEFALAEHRIFRTKADNVTVIVVLLK